MIVPVFFFPREPQKSAREHFGKSAREPFEFAREHFWKTCPWTWKSARERELSARESSKCPWTIFWKVPVNLKSVREQFLEKFIYWQIFLIWVSHYDGDKPANKPNKLSPLFDCTLAGI